MKNIYKLTQEDIAKITEYNEAMTKHYDTFAYFINNCVSYRGCPMWLGSAISDILYWEKRKVDPSIVGYAVNEVFYDGFDNIEEFISNICKVLCYEEKDIEIYKKRLASRYLGKIFESKEML